MSADLAGAYELALWKIVDGDLPCLTCGEHHVQHSVCNNPAHGVTWASQKDGHARRPMTPSEYARSVLEAAQSFNPQAAS